MKRKIYASILLVVMLINIFPYQLLASSHREAPLIANDPLADNTDLYVFRSPDKPNTITILANYVPLQLPQGVLITIHLVKISATKFISIMILPQMVMILFIVSLLIRRMKTQLRFSISGWENKI